MSKRKSNRCSCGSKKMYKNCCGKGKKKVIKSIGRFDKDPADDPRYTLSDLAEVAMSNIDGKEYLMLIPRDEWEDHLDFDRNAVKLLNPMRADGYLGPIEFVRPTMKSDRPQDDNYNQFENRTDEDGKTFQMLGSTSHVIVAGNTNLRTRTRTPIDLTFLKAE